MSEQLKNILLWGAFGLVAVLGFVVIYNAIADEAADAERDTHAPYLTRVLNHVIKHRSEEMMPAAATTTPVVPAVMPKGK